MSIQWSGSFDLDGVEAAIAAAVKDGMTKATEHVLTESRKVVPIEEGTLERSGRTGVEQDGTTTTGGIGYSTPYAIKQHEDTTLRHDQNRTAKYLERPLHSEADTVRAIVTQALREALR